VHKKIISIYLKTLDKAPNLPCVVRFTRIAPRKIDEDNFLPGLKYVRDAIADYLIPGLAPGRADGDERIQWIYEQRKGTTHEVALEITFEENELSEDSL